MGESPYRRATEPRTVSASRMAPSSKSSGADTDIGSALVDEVPDGCDAVPGADHDQHVVGLQGFFRPW